MNLLQHTIKIRHTSPHPLPSYKTPGAAGMDLYAHLSEPCVLPPRGKAMIHTGIFLEIPRGLEGQVRSRSSLASRGIIVTNTPGTIDSDYRGEVKVLLTNLTENTFTIHDGDRIAQLVVAPYITVTWEKTATLHTTERGEGGFGSTGQR